jgi:selenide,water dikinase
VHPERIITNAGSRPGDALILTKPLGSGVLFNAVRSGKFPYPDLERETLPTLAALNGAAMEAALKYNLHACTDITGFGILGHVLEVAHGSDARVALKYKDLPFYPGALEMYEKGETTGSNLANRAMVAKHHLKIEKKLTTPEEELLYDPQTSGGLLLSVADSDAQSLLTDLHEAGVAYAVQIGQVIDEPVGIVVC